MFIKPPSIQELGVVKTIYFCAFTTTYTNWLFLVSSLSFHLNSCSSVLNILWGIFETSWCFYFVGLHTDILKSCCAWVQVWVNLAATATSHFVDCFLKNWCQTRSHREQNRGVLRKRVGKRQRQEVERKTGHQDIIYIKKET